jgi:hypothetical protein
MPRISFTNSVLGVALLLGAGIATLGAASAQSTNGILAPGNAVVTGFSGTKVPAAPPPGTDPADLTEIDLTGPAARIADLQSPGAPPQAQLIAAPKPFTASAAQIGQVFAVTLDDAATPNIYVAATSAYGLPIIAPGPGGALMRARQGSAAAQFMPGLFGPANAGGGPGSIWRIDGATGEVKLFANVALDGLANPGTGLGGLTFDAATHTLFVADRGTGMIHAFDLSGAERGRFDHGVDGRTAAGLPPTPYDAAGRLDISKEAFKTDDPATWGYAADTRRIFGLAVHAGRLYYALADEEVWSVAIGPNGSFGSDARIELQVQPWDGQSEISKIAFDDQGGMLLAERPAPTGAYDFNALAQEGTGRVLHYQRVAPAAAAPTGPGDQPQPANAAVPGQGWQPVADEYAIGFPRDLRNDNGGVAIGYGYTPSGTIDRAACGGFIWSTGEQLRVSQDQALAARLAAGGPAVVNGLQGNAIEALRPANVPPLATYFVDYDDQFVDPAARGHMGDIAIWRVCSQAFVPSFPVPSLVVVPPGFCERGLVRLVGGECCERRYVRNGRCGCTQEQIRNGQCCTPEQMRNGRCCTPEQIREGRCCTPEQIREGKCCTPEQIRAGKCCTPEQMREGRCCTPEQIRAGKCCTPEQIRAGKCCPPDAIRGPNGQCCTPEQMGNGQCCTPEQIRSGRCGCPPDTIRLPNGVCCLRQNVHGGKCEPTPPCPTGQVSVNGVCCDPQHVHNGRCEPNPPRCPTGQVSVNGVCCDPRAPNRQCAPPPPSCPPGQVRINGVCEAIILHPPRHWPPPHIRPPHREPPRHVVPHGKQRGTGTRTQQQNLQRRNQPTGTHFGGRTLQH